MSTEPATSPQISFLTALITDRKSILAEGVTVEQAVAGLSHSKKAASDAISQLLKLPKDSAPAPASAPVKAAPAPAAKRVNNYAGKCADCGKQVAAREGWIDKSCGFWVTHHHVCPPSEADVAKQITNVLDQFEIPNGYYAVPSVSGHNDLWFVNVKDRPRGGRYVKLYLGGRGDASTLSLDSVKAVIDHIKAQGVEESAHLFADKLGRCCRCSRELTDETSRARRMGPECAAA